MGQDAKKQDNENPCVGNKRYSVQAKPGSREIIDRQ